MAKAKKQAQGAGAKKTAAKKQAATKGVVVGEAVITAKVCPKCGGPLEVIAADHKAGKVTWGCPKCDGSQVEATRAASKATITKDIDALGRARAAREAKKEAKVKADRERAERLGLEAPAAKTKAPRKPKAKGQMSGLDAAAKVLAEAGEPLDTKTIVERAVAKGYWQTSGATPAATIYAAILREMQAKGSAARFTKPAPGKFALVGAVA